jgi:3-oxoacyl-(acyl-carrier-protein) synthase
MARRKVVVTGFGVIASNGTGVAQFWRNVAEGVNGVTPSLAHLKHGFASRAYGAVKDFEPFGHGAPRTISVRRGRHVEFALAASSMAIEDARIDSDTLDADRFGVVISTAVADAGSMERDLLLLSADGRIAVDATRAEARFVDSLDFGRAARETAMRFNARGAVTTISTGCTAGLDALGFAVDEIREGRADVMLAGASEAPLCPLAIGSFEALGALSTRSCADPTEASTPFSADRDGFVIAEGCGMMVLESEEHVAARGARVYAELAGFASVNNAYHMTDLAPDGLAMARCISLALDDAGCDPAVIDHVSAHGSSTPQNDVNETAAIKSVFGARAKHIPINSLKSMTGHALSASNAIEAIAVCLEIHNGLLHPTINYRRPAEECDLDYVPNVARPAKIGAALKLASGFSGIHSVLVIRAANGC